MTAGSGGPANLDVIAEASGQFHYEHCSGVGPVAWCDCDCAGPTLLEALVAEVKRLRGFAERVAALGDPAVPDVLERRRRVTLGQLIAHAVRALDPGAEPEEQQR